MRGTWDGAAFISGGGSGALAWVLTIAILGKAGGDAGVELAMARATVAGTDVGTISAAVLAGATFGGAVMIELESWVLVGTEVEAVVVTRIESWIDAAGVSEVVTDGRGGCRQDGGSWVWCRSTRKGQGR